MKLCFYIFLPIYLVSLNFCGDKSPDKIVENNLHPGKDTLCEKDTQRAKKDFEKGKLVFCYPFGFGSHMLRQEKQLKTLCANYNLIFDYELINDVLFEGQTQG